MQNLSPQAGTGTSAARTELYERLLALARSERSTDWFARIRTLLVESGFQWFLVSLGTADTDPDVFRNIETNYPTAWLEYYKENELLHTDPIVKQCRKHCSPILWHDNPYSSAGACQRFWHERQRHGLRYGCTIPLHHTHPPGSINVGQASLPRDTVSPGSIKVWSYLFLMAPFALEGMARVRQRPKKPGQRLSPREQECLRWAAIGKTSWEVGAIVGCSERTANYHLANATRKLNASNRQQAIGTALSKGLITL